jgi:peptide/nickel transport system substrate-binding protein
MVDAATEQWLTPSEVKALNPYSVNFTKAADLLRSAGFHKVGSQWMLPNGQPWTVTLTTVSQFSSWMALSQLIKNELDQFGIATKVVAMTFPQELQAQSAGQLALSVYDDGEGPNPYFAYSRIFGAPDGYLVKNGHLVHNQPTTPGGGNWVDFPTTVHLAGRVVDPGQLTQQLDQTNNPDIVRRDTQILAEITNQYVPQITLWDVARTGWVNTKRFSDYPLNNAALMSATYNFEPPIGLWMMNHYIRPSS